MEYKPFQKPAGLTRESFIHCAYIGCKATVDATDLCPSCNRFVCKEHRLRDPGEHRDGEKHWEE